MSARGLVPLKPASRVVRLLPWLLLWVAAPMPLWIALAMSFVMGR